MQQRSVLSCTICALTIAFAGVAAPGADKEKSFPKGSEKAVAGVRKEFPKSQIDEVAEPKGFGGSGGKGTPLFWSVRFHTGDEKHELAVIPDGTIMRLPIPVKPADLPKPVARGVEKAAAGATVKRAVKNEIRATLKYVALDHADVRQYAIDVKKDGKRSRVTMDAKGGNAKVTALPKEKKEAGEDKKEDKKKVPPEAAKAFEAMKAVHPGAVYQGYTLEVFDDGSGKTEILTYEIEFFVKGKKHEMVASPEGVIPHLWAPVKAKALPKAVRAALDKAVPGAEVEQARALEIRAGLRFAAIKKPKVYYTVTVEKDGKDTTLNVKPDGSLVKRAAFPGKK
jgi:hypothetical protein